MGPLGVHNVPLDFLWICLYVICEMSSHSMRQIVLYCYVKPIKNIVRRDWNRETTERPSKVDIGWILILLFRPFSILMLCLAFEYFGTLGILSMLIDKRSVVGLFLGLRDRSFYMRDFGICVLIFFGIGIDRFIFLGIWDLTIIFPGFWDQTHSYPPS